MIDFDDPIVNLLLRVAGAVCLTTINDDNGLGKGMAATEFDFTAADHSPVDTSFKESLFNRLLLEKSSSGSVAALN